MIAGLEIYHEWGFKINREVVEYLQFPKEAWASSLNSPIVLVFTIYFIYTFFFLKWSRRIANALPNIAADASGLNIKWIAKNGSAGILSIILFGVCLRGGLQQSPINQSFAYYSTDTALNAAAVNTVWNFIYSYSRKGQVPFLDSSQQPTQILLLECQ